MKTVYYAKLIIDNSTLYKIGVTTNLPNRLKSIGNDAKLIHRLDLHNNKAVELEKFIKARYIGLTLASAGVVLKGVHSTETFLEHILFGKDLEDMIDAMAEVEKLKKHRKPKANRRRKPGRFSRLNGLQHLLGLSVADIEDIFTIKDYSITEEQADTMSESLSWYELRLDFDKSIVNDKPLDTKQLHKLEDVVTRVVREQVLYHEL